MRRSGGLSWMKFDYSNRRFGKMTETRVNFNWASSLGFRLKEVSKARAPLVGCLCVRQTNAKYGCEICCFRLGVASDECSSLVHWKTSISSSQSAIFKHTLRQKTKDNRALKTNCSIEQRPECRERFGDLAGLLAVMNSVTTFARLDDKQRR